MTDAMDAAHVYRPRGLMFVLAVLIILGSAAVFGSIVNARTVDRARREATAQNTALLYEVRRQNHDLCRRAVAIATAAGIATEPCPPLQELPEENE